MKEIMQDYERTKENNKRELEERKKKIYAKIPRLKEIEDEMINLGIQITRSVLFSDKNKSELLESLKEKQRSLKTEKKEILSSHEYPENYLDLKYDCSKCQDTGFVNINPCECLKQKQILYNYNQSNLSKRFSIENFDNFNINYYSDEIKKNGITSKRNMQHIYLECLRYVKDFDKNNRNILFIGRPGLGKTFLCHAIAGDLLKMGKSVIYQSAPDLIELVRKHMFNFDNEKQSHEALQDIYECDLLIIDDLGTELSTKFSNLVLYNILNKRYIESKKIIIATNLDVEEILESYSERITSRIFGHFRMFEFFGKDIRLIMKMS